MQRAEAARTRFERNHAALYDLYPDLLIVLGRWERYAGEMNERLAALVPSAPEEAER